jgi:type I restriction enzyme S subunit
MGEWKEINIGNDATLSYGKMPKKDLLGKGNYPTFSGYKYQYLYPESNCKKEDLIVVARGVGGTGDVKIIKEDAYLTNLSIKIDFDPDIVDNQFFYYYFHKETLRYLDSGSAQSQITITDLKSESFLFPKLPEQKAIASVLSSLDDKIDLLHRQNKTLEAMAETLFRQWFVNSDYSCKVSDLIEIQNGYAFKSKNFKDVGVNGVIKIKNISGDVVDIYHCDFIEDLVANQTDSRFVIETGDVLFAMTGAEIGKMGIVLQTERKLWLNQRVGLFKEKYNGSRFLAYLQLKSDYGQDYIDNTATGSAQPNISGTGIENCEFPKIIENQIKEYSEKLLCLYEKVIFNLGQIRTLEKLRDTLLPKLMGGEVRVQYNKETTA